MRRHPFLKFSHLNAAIAAACFLLAAALAFADEGNQAEFNPKIYADCFAKSYEIILVPALACVPHYDGAKLGQLEETLLNSEDPDVICKSPAHPRRLAVDAIKRIAGYRASSEGYQGGPIWPMGIRIFGAVFCPSDSVHGLELLKAPIALDLAGLDLPYSLVIDHSIVNGIIDARNLRIKGDFSLDYAKITQRLNLNRARVDGSFYANNSFMRQLVVNDTTVNGTWWQRESIVAADVEFRQVHITGDLSLRKTAFGQLLLHSSSVAGTLALDASEARCSYYVDASSFGFITANTAGFGVLTATGSTDDQIVYPWWDTAAPSRKGLFEKGVVKEILEKEATKIVELERKNRNTDVVSSNHGNNDLKRISGCKDLSESGNLEFSVIDSNVQAALCLSSFAWAKNAPSTNEQPLQIISLNGTKIGGNLVLDIVDSAAANPVFSKKESDDHPLNRKHRLEAVNLSAGALINNFSDSSYVTHLDGLRFDQVHKVKQSRCTDLASITLPADVKTPAVSDVLGWLEKNEARSSQPFTAFVESFGRAGENVIDLRVERETIDLCKASPGWVRSIALPCHRFRFAALKSDQTDIDARRTDFISASSEFATVGFRWILYVLADHGLRPGKVLWSVTLTLVLFAELFWFGLGVVGYESKSNDDRKPTASRPIIWPVISFLFLFDRLIPLYEIRKEHYAITTVYRRASKKEIQERQASEAAPPYAMSFYGQTLYVWPLGSEKLAQFEAWLAVLRIIGVVLAVFLLAAIKKLAD
jgi:hypothetical protein